MLKKLSLAALVAMGSMSVASATDLSQAIKGVNLTGYVRLRVYNDSDKTYNTRWRTTSAFKFAIPVTENLKFHTNYALDWDIYNNFNPTSGKAATSPVNVHMFVDYTKNGANVILGKIPVNTPVTATGVGEAIAAGAIAKYKVNDQIAVAGAWLDDLANTDQVTVGGKDTYAAAVIYNSDIADAQVWYFNVDNIIDSDVVVMADIKALQDKGVAIHADFATANLDNTISSDTQTYYNISAKYSKDKVCAKLGYAATGKDGGTVTLDADSPLASVLPTEQQTGITDTADNSVVYGKVGYKVDAKTNVFVAFSSVDAKSSNEYLVGAKYAYTKKFGVYAYYSILDQNSNGQDNNEARVELKYTF